MNQDRNAPTPDTVTCCICYGRPVPSELLAARVFKPATLTRRDLNAAHNELTTDILAAEDVIDTHAAPARIPAPQDGTPTPGPAAANGDAAAGHSPAGEGQRADRKAGPPGMEVRGRHVSPRTPEPGPGALDEHACPEALAAAEAIERGRLAREEASDVETPPLVILGQGEYARTIPAAHVDDEWLRDFARRTGRA